MAQIVCLCKFLGYTRIMKRAIFYILLLAAVVGSTCVVLLIEDWSGLDITREFIRAVIDGTFVWGTTSAHFYIYALMLFWILNASTLLTLFLIFMFSKFRFRNIRRPYRISLWWLFSAILITAFWAWPYISFNGWTFDFDHLKFVLIPLASALVTCVVGLVFSILDRRR